MSFTHYVVICNIWCCILLSFLSMTIQQHEKQIESIIVKEKMLFATIKDLCSVCLLTNWRAASICIGPIGHCLLKLVPHSIAHQFSCSKSLCFSVLHYLLALYISFKKRENTKAVPHPIKNIFYTEACPGSPWCLYLCFYLQTCDFL